MYLYAIETKQTLTNAKNYQYLKKTEMKTVLNQLIDIIIEKRKESDISNTLLRFVQLEAEKLLQQEKKQIKDACERLDYDFNNSDEYYDFTYGQSCSQAEW